MEQFIKYLTVCWGRYGNDADGRKELSGITRSHENRLNVTVGGNFPRVSHLACGRRHGGPNTAAGKQGRVASCAECAVVRLRGNRYHGPARGRAGALRSETVSRDANGDFDISATFEIDTLQIDQVTRNRYCKCNTPC